MSLLQGFYYEHGIRTLQRFHKIAWIFYEEAGVGGKELERETGFEPATSTLARLHSTTELFPPKTPYPYKQQRFLCQGTFAGPPAESGFFSERLLSPVNFTVFLIMPIQFY